MAADEGLNHKEQLALNALSTIRVSGLLANEELITLTRRTAPLDLVIPIISPTPTRRVKPYRPVPPRVIPASLALTPPGDVCLRLRLGEVVGSGGTGRVYAVDVLDSGPEGDSEKYHIPPLVAKVARRGRRGHLAREAWFYDELAVLQGVSFARCYGWFEAEVSGSDEEAMAILPWVVQSRKNGKNGPTIDSMSPPARAELKSWGRDLYALGTTTNVISILLLERLSDERMPSGIKLDESFRQEILDTYNETSPLGVQIRDIRHANTLRAPSSPSASPSPSFPSSSFPSASSSFPNAHALPSLPSPFTGKTHAWRIVDLERCVKVNFNTPSIVNPHCSWLGGLFDALEEGTIFESWMVN